MTKSFPGQFRRTHTWYKLPLPLNKACCSEGSPYHAWVKKGTTENLLVYFDGGGISWDATSAATPISLWVYFCRQPMTYMSTINFVAENSFDGILAAHDTRNPFNDWNVLRIAYATGDLHVGNNDFPYTDRKGRARILHHCGARNANAVLDLAWDLLPAPRKMLIAGSSAGGWGCLAQAENVISHYPQAEEITIFSDSAQIAYPHWKEVIRDVWKGESDLWKCIHTDHINLEWFRLLYQKYGDRISYLNACSCWDRSLSSFQNNMNHGTYRVDPLGLAEFQTELAFVQKSLLKEIPDFSCYINAENENKRTCATAHSVLTNRWYYVKDRGRLSMAEWLADVIHCGKKYSAGLDLIGLAGE